VLPPAVGQAQDCPYGAGLTKWTSSGANSYGRRLPRLFIQPAIVETLHVGEDVTRQLPAVRFLQAQGLTQCGCQPLPAPAAWRPGQSARPGNRRTATRTVSDSRDLAAMHTASITEAADPGTEGEMAQGMSTRSAACSWFQGANQTRPKHRGLGPYSVAICKTWARLVPCRPLPGSRCSRRTRRISCTCHDHR